MEGVGDEECGGGGGEALDFVMVGGAGGLGGHGALVEIAACASAPGAVFPVQHIPVLIVEDNHAVGVAIRVAGVAEGVVGKGEVNLGGSEGIWQIG